MMNLALWLKKNNFRLDQVQTFTPTPMAMATTMWHTRRNPLKKLSAVQKRWTWCAMAIAASCTRPFALSPPGQLADHPRRPD
jgi:hypothetical protein